VATLGLPEPGTIDHTAAGLTDALAKPLSTTDPSHAPVMPTVPGYDLLAPLGEGGMGVVWKARQVKLNRLVALKMVLGGQRAGSKELIRFLAEAESVAAVKHTHIVQVYEYGEVNGRPFLAMEYLPGGSLADRLDRTDPLDPKTAAELVATLADAVQAAHDLGIVHRDLKPTNVLYDEHDQPKVTDFGLAKRVGGSDLTATQAVMGTPAYMAPEQARGDTKFVGPQADVHSLGVILYECLTRTRPFEALDQLALLRKVAEDEPERPGKRVPGLPQDVELICLKCLAKDPAERYPTAGSLAADLRRFAAGESVSVRAPGVVERATKWARRKPTLAAAYTLGLLAVLLGGLGGAAVWQWRAAERARNVAEVARGEAVMARDGETKARAQLAAVEYGRTMQVAHQEWRENNVPATVALLDSTQADRRGWEWRYVHRLCHTDLLTLNGHTGMILSASFSPDGSRVLTGSADNTAKVWDAKNGAEVLTLKGHTNLVSSASFSPDGSRILTGSRDQTAKVWDARSGAEILTLKGHTEGVNSASFSPDGSRVLTGSGDKTAKVRDATPINREFPPREFAPPPRVVR
jgi:tRNA A-37 threonylcarbamoyl transferase component Bud32